MATIKVKVKPIPKVTGARTQKRNEESKQLSEMAEQAFKETMLQPPPLPSTVLQLADAAINSRMENYGQQLENFSNIADIWTVLLNKKLVEPITPQDVAMCMAGLKLARLVKTAGGHRDSIIDVAGYAECLDQINQACEDKALGSSL